MAALKCILFLTCWSFTGVAATDSLMMHYQLKNSSVCFHVKQKPPFQNGQWAFEDTVIVIDRTVNPNYTERVKIHENLTLCINRLTEKDTGIIKFSYVSNFVTKLENHQIIVQDVVPTPVITVTPDNNFNLSSGPCNFTVNCSIQNDWLWSICDKESCRILQKSFKKFNISIFTKSTTVVCSGKNYVSMNNITKSFSTICSVKSNLEQEKESQPSPKISEMVYFIIPLIAALFIVCAFIIAKKIWKSKHNQETSAAQLIQSGPLETQPPSEPRVSTSSSEADPSYENVETSQPRENSIPRNEQVFSESLMVDTVYSIPKKPASCIKSDKRNNPLANGKTQETLTSGSANVNEEQKLTQIESVYSVLQMPKNS